MFEAADETWRTELATRESNGITVRLFWSRSTNLVTVAVADTANDDYWGDGGDGSGKNRLGHLLMQVREELRNG